MSLRRTDFTGPALIRLLARLQEAQLPESQQAFADRLSHWLGWTDAIALSAALQGGPGLASAPPADAHPLPAGAEEGECARVRAALTRSIAEDNLFVTAPPEPPKAPARGMYVRGAAYEPPAPPPPAANEADFTPYRLRYQARQQAMDAGIGALRERLRAGVAARPGDAARLAALDTVMEQVLGEQERRLLGALPNVLEKHYQRLRRQHQQALADAAAESPTPAQPQHSGWLYQFGQDAQTMLQSELDIRFKPVEGLLEALRK